MVKLIDKQNLFNTGIISPKLFSRDEMKKYNSGLADSYNFVCSRYGPIEKRVGTQFIWDLGNPGEEIFLLPFVFSIKQSLLLEFRAIKNPGEGESATATIRFYTFNGTAFSAIEDPGNPGHQYEITATGLTAAQLPNISYAQSLDKIYLAFADGNTPPKVLTRYANNNWTIANFDAVDGPYLDTNFSTSKTMTITDRNTTTSTVTCSGFSLGAADIGRWLRINTPRYNENTHVYEDKWSSGKITAVSGSNLTVSWEYRSIVNEADQSWMTATVSGWRLGVWHSGTSDSQAYPVTYPTKVTIHQQRLTWGGSTDKPWIWMSCSFAYRNYAPSDYEGEIADNNAIYADISTDKVSDIFWVKSVKSLLIGTELGEIRMYSGGTALSPSDVVSSRESSYGSYHAEPVVTDELVIFIQRLQRTIRALTYDYNYDAFVGPELTVFSESITAGGIKKIVHQKEPNYTVWCTKEDGSLLSLTYDKDQEVVGWSRSNVAGENSKIIDMAVLPSSDYQQDMVFFVVERKIGDNTVRYLEMLSRNYVEGTELKDMSFVDSFLRITSETEFNTIAGLNHLAGQEVLVLDEGALVGRFEVSDDGTVTLPEDTYVTDAVVGLPYDAYFETLERDFQDKQLSTKMARLRVYKLRMYLDHTLGVMIKRLERGGESILKTFDPSYYMDRVPVPLTGLVDIEVPSNWECDYRLKVISDPGMPCTVSGIIMGIEVNAI